MKKAMNMAAAVMVFMAAAVMIAGGANLAVTDVASHATPGLVDEVNTAFGQVEAWSTNQTVGITSGNIAEARLTNAVATATLLSLSAARLTAGTVASAISGGSITNIDGENIQADTIDDDSIDFADVTGADLTLTDATSVRASTDLRLDGVSAVVGYSVSALRVDWFAGVTNNQTVVFSALFNGVPAITATYSSTGAVTQDVGAVICEIVSKTTSNCVVKAAEAKTVDLTIIGLKP